MHWIGYTFWTSLHCDNFYFFKYVTSTIPYSIEVSHDKIYIHTCMTGLFVIRRMRLRYLLWFLLQTIPHFTSSRPITQRKSTTKIKCDSLFITITLSDITISSFILVLFNHWYDIPDISYRYHILAWLVAVNKTQENQKGIPWTCVLNVVLKEYMHTYLRSE